MRISHQPARARRPRRSLSRYVRTCRQGSALSRCAGLWLTTLYPQVGVVQIPCDAHALCRTTKEDNMYRLLLTSTAAVAILTTTSLIPNRAAAIPLSGLADIPLASKQVNTIALCFYLDGWNGPGLYQC